MDRSLLSVIVPTKNEEAIIEDCLRALQKQRTAHPYEVIVVDAQSQDKTREIASRYGARIVIEDRPGKGLARQKGAEEARGEILCFTEADCQVPETWIETIAQAFSADAMTIAVTGGYTLTKSNWFYGLLVRIYHPISVHLFYLLYGHHSLRATNFAVRARAFWEVGGFNTDTMELDDVEFSMRARKYGVIRFHPKMGVRTLDRRFRHRLGSYLVEFTVSYYKIGIRRQALARPVYKDIR